MHLFVCNSAVSSPSLIAGDVSLNPEELLDNFLILTLHMYVNG